MTPEPTFTIPSAHITAAREAMVRLHRHLGHVVGALDATGDLSALAFAVLTLETVNPPYPPLHLDLPTRSGPTADLRAAIQALQTASVEADTARETLRLAYVIRDLRELEDSPYLDVASENDRGRRL